MELNQFLFQNALIFWINSPSLIWFIGWSHVYPLKIFEANTNCKGVAIVPLPYDIETKYIRINPVDFENAIAMKVEFYGCKSTAPETTGK